MYLPRLTLAPWRDVGPLLPIPEGHRPTAGDDGLRHSVRVFGRRPRSPVTLLVALSSSRGRAASVAGLRGLGVDYARPDLRRVCRRAPASTYVTPYLVFPFRPRVPSTYFLTVRYAPFVVKSLHVLLEAPRRFANPPPRPSQPGLRPHASPASTRGADSPPCYVLEAQRRT